MLPRISPSRGCWGTPQRLPIWMSRFAAAKHCLHRRHRAAYYPKNSWSRRCRDGSTYRIVSMRFAIRVASRSRCSFPMAFSPSPCRATGCTARPLTSSSCGWWGRRWCCWRWPLFFYAIRSSRCAAWRPQPTGSARGSKSRSSRSKVRSRFVRRQSPLSRCATGFSGKYVSAHRCWLEYRMICAHR